MRLREVVAGLSATTGPGSGGPITPDAVTDAALFLLSDQARMITGQVIRVDGGWSVSEPR